MHSTVVKIRTLTPADAEEFWKLRLEGLQREPAAFGESEAEHRSKPIAAIRERLADNSGDFVVGAFRERALVGVAGCYRPMGEKVRHKGVVWGVYVSPSARRQGIGRQLLEYIVERARGTDGIEQLYLHVAETQDAARRLYESLGFRHCGTEPRALKIGERYVDENVMVLHL